jgi:hypothetical protein
LYLNNQKRNKTQTPHSNISSVVIKWEFKTFIFPFLKLIWNEFLVFFFSDLPCVKEIKGQSYNNTLMAEETTTWRANIKELPWEPYHEAVNNWPRSGRHILAHYDEDSVVVFQAYKRAIGSYAATHKTFVGCPDFSTTRMTWVKTSFLWMQYRSGWGKKHNQEVTLAIWLKREGFEKILKIAREARQFEDRGSNKPKRGKVSNSSNDGESPEKRERSQGTVRLQWDPDHTPKGGNG